MGGEASLTTHSSCWHTRMATLGPNISADEALQRLVDGNERFLNGQTRWDRVTVGIARHARERPAALRHHPRLQ